ncbi:MAG: hypothetical protein J7J96_07755 [Sulfurimonas sp.]|nr:hypothetical protein [Sulfurimonas sp.]
MKELILFFTGLFIGFFYFGHLYLQLRNLKKEYKPSLFFTFPIRFLLLSTILGIIFYQFNTLAIYTIIGLLVSRFGVYYNSKIF